MNISLLAIREIKNWLREYEYVVCAPRPFTYSELVTYIRQQLPLFDTTTIPKFDSATSVILTDIVDSSD